MFSFVHKILVNAPTIPVVMNNSWFIHLSKKEKKKLPSLFINVFRYLKKVHFKREVTTGHYVRARVSLADKRILAFPKLSYLLTNATKDHLMSYLSCLKTISGPLYDFNRSTWSISFQNLTTLSDVPKQCQHFRDFRKFTTQSKMFHDSRLTQIFIHGWRSTRKRKIVHVDMEGSYHL